MPFDGYFYCGYYKENRLDQRECPFWRLACDGSKICKFLNLGTENKIARGMCRDRRAYEDVCKGGWENEQAES